MVNGGGALWRRWVRVTAATVKVPASMAARWVSASVGVRDDGLLAVDPGQLGMDPARADRPIKVDRQAPVFLGNERGDLAFPIDDQADGHALYPTGRQAAPDLAGDQRAELVAHQAVDDPPGLLGVDQVQVQAAGRREGGLDGRLGDLAEGHPANAVLVDPGVLGDMPGDRLALAIKVGGQPHGVRLLGAHRSGDPAPCGGR